MAVAGKGLNSGTVSGPGTLGGSTPKHGSLEWQVQQGWITPEAAQQQNYINTGSWGAPTQQAPATQSSQDPLQQLVQGNNAPRQFPAQTQTPEQFAGMSQAQLVSMMGPPKDNMNYAPTPQYQQFQQQLANGATTRGSTPMQQWQQSTAGMQPQQPYTPPAQAPQGPAPYMPMDQLKASLSQQVASKGITQAQADAEIARMQGEWDKYNKGSNQNVGAQLMGAQGFDIGAAQRALQDQVNKGWINQAQMDQQMALNQKQAYPDFGNTGMGQAANIANIQGNLNQQNMQQQAQYNRVNEYNPYGQSEYRQNPDGSYSRISSLSPEQQALLDSQQQRDLAFSGGMSGLAGQGIANLQQPFNYGAMPKALGMEDLQGDRKRVEDQVYGQYEGDINRDYDREMQAFRQRMANQGIPEGSEMYQRGMQDMSLRKQDALNRARSSAMMTSRSEMESIFDMGDRSRSRGIAEAKDLRYMPLDEVARLGALSGGVQNPQFAGMAQIQAPQIDFGGYASNFMGQDYGLGIYKDKAAFDQEMQRQQYLWQKAQEEKGGGGGGGSSGGGGSWY